MDRPKILEIVVTRSFILHIKIRMNLNQRLLSGPEGYCYENQEFTQILKSHTDITTSSSCNCYIRPAVDVIYDFGFNNHNHDERKMLHLVKHSMYLLIPTKNEELNQLLAANSIGNFSRSIFLAKHYIFFTCTSRKHTIINKLVNISLSYTEFIFDELI